MAKYTVDLDGCSTKLETKMGDTMDFFDIAIIEDKKETWCRLSETESETLIIALQQYVARKKKTTR